MQNTNITPESAGWETQDNGDMPSWWFESYRKRYRPNADMTNDMTRKEVRYEACESWFADRFFAEHPDLDAGVLGRGKTEDAAKSDAISRHRFNR